MKERPILFSAPMVRAILAGTKTQTRRVVKNTGLYAIDAAFHGGETARRELLALASRCPYGGRPGDRLWVREAWSDDCDPHWVMYRADNRAERRAAGEVFDACSASELNPSPKWRPSIHMPRAASRITLEVTAVRVERLHDISEADARAEGAEEAPLPMGIMYSQAAVMRTRYREGFGRLWCSINGAGSWDANPWVWVVEFRRAAA